MKTRYEESLSVLKARSDYNPKLHKVKSLSLSVDKRGRPLYLKDLDALVIKKLMDLRETGAVINSKIAIMVGRQLVTQEAPQLLTENGGQARLTPSWASSLFKRMGFSCRRATTGKLLLPEAVIEEESFRFVQAVAEEAQKNEVPDCLILNWDQTPLKYVPAGTRTVAKRGSSKVSIGGLADKRAITAVFTVTLSGDFLPMQLIYPGKSALSHPQVSFPAGFHVTHNPSHWSYEETTEEYKTEILEPYLTKVREEIGSPDKPAILIYDAFRAHTMDHIQMKLVSLNAVLIQVPKNMTDTLQPLDISVNKPAKDFLRDRFSEWYAQKLLEVDSTPGT